MRPRLLPLAGALATLAVLASASPAATRDTYDAHRMKSAAPVAGLAGKRAESTATLVAPSSWRIVGKPSRTRLRLRAPGTELCSWSFTFSTRVVLAADSAAADVAARRVPGEGAYLLDHGTRGAGAWRVVRPQAESDLVGTRLDPVTGEQGLPKGKRLWREITARATFGDDDCHTGTYRDFAGPRMGDVLAVAKGRASIL